MLLESREVFREIRILIENLNVSNCIFRANHASNYMPLGGTLPQDKERLLQEVDEYYNMDSNDYRPEWMRGL